MTTQYKWLPEQPTTEMVNRVFNKLGKEVDKEFFILMWKMMWQSAAEVEQEPAAIVRRYRDGTVVAEIRDKNMDEATELYTHPRKNREPLSDHEIKQLLKRDDGLDVVDLVRAVEKAHGIGDQ